MFHEAIYNLGMLYGNEVKSIFQPIGNPLVYLTVYLTYKINKMMFLLLLLKGRNV